MSTIHGSERRGFGRRSTIQHGWIKVPGRPERACVVENISVAGALLRCEGARALPFAFDLSIDSSGFQAHCEVRHVSETHVGVRFVDRLSVSEPARKSARPSSDEVTVWTGPPRRT
jgi:hypothetical protein